MNIFRFRDIEYKIKHQYVIKFCTDLEKPQDEEGGKGKGGDKGKGKDKGKAGDGEEEEVVDDHEQDLPQDTDISGFPFQIKIS